MKRYRLSLAIVLGLFALGPFSPAAAERSCVMAPPDDPNPVVMICEDEEHYTFKRGDEHQSYPKASFRSDVLTMLSSWLQEKSLPPSLLCEAELSLWLSIPESVVTAAQLRLSVTNDTMPFIAYLPWDKDRWQSSPLNIAILPEKPYPESFGYRSGTLLIKKKAHHSTAALNSYLAPFGVHSPAPFGQDWLSYELQPLKEPAILAEIKNDLRFAFYAEDATLNPIFEWIATRTKAFSFLGSCDLP